MDSINQPKPEKNHEDPEGQQAGWKIKELANKADTCFFCTKNTTGLPLKVHPMWVRKVGENNNFYFFKALDSHQTRIFRPTPSTPFVSGAGTQQLSECFWHGYH